MPEEKRSIYPWPTRESFDAAPGDRVAKGARNVAANDFQGIPQGAFLHGENDDSPVMRSIRVFVGAVYDLLDEINVGEEGGGPLDTAARRVQEILEVPNIHPHQATGNEG